MVDYTIYSRSHEESKLARPLTARYHGAGALERSTSGQFRSAITEWHKGHVDSVRRTSKITSMTDMRRIKEVLKGKVHGEYATFGWFSVFSRCSRAVSDSVCVCGFVCRIEIGVKTTPVVSQCRKTDCRSAEKRTATPKYHLECGSGEDIVEK